MAALDPTRPAPRPGRLPPSGPLVTVVLIALAELIERALRLGSNLTSIYLLGIVYATFVGGIAGGLLSSALALGAALAVLAAPGAPFHYAPDDLVRLLFLAVGGPATTLMVGALRTRAARAAGLAERLAAAEALRRSEERFHLLVDAVQDYAICLLDADGRVASWNAGAEHITGYRAAEIVGQPYTTFFTPEDVAAGCPDQELATAARDGRCRAEGWRVRQDGRHFWADVVVTALRDEGGRLRGFAKVTHDVTERRAVEAAQRRHVHLLEQAHEAIIAWELGGTITSWNRAAAELYGYTEVEALGRISHDLLHTRHLRGTAWLVTELKRAGRWEGPLRYTTRDGRELVIESRMVLVREDSNRAYVIEADRDITAHVRAELSLRFLADAGQQLATSLDLDETIARVVSLGVPALADGCVIYLTDEDGGVARWEATHADPARADLLREVEARYPLAEALKALAGRARRGGQTGLIEARTAALARDADHRRLLRALDLRSVLSVPLRLDERRFGSLVLLLTGAGRRFDATDRTVVEELARRAAMALENARLFSQARAAVRVREEFLSIASHELKTPLTTVKGYVQMLDRQLRRDEPDHDHLIQYTDPLQRQVGRLETLVNDLLDVSRLQQGRLELRAEPVDLSDLARQVVARFEHSPLRMPSHRLIVEAPAPVAGRWDAGRLDQVLTNLVSNALKYSPAGGEVRLTVRREGEAAALTVRDQGLGIGPEERRLIFQPFSRGKAATARTIQGVGLGLYIAAQIVERHGGTIAVESEPGLGSAFTLRLPPAIPADGAAWGAGAIASRDGQPWLPAAAAGSATVTA